MDSVAREFLEAERDTVQSPSIRITGIAMQYYAICKRELWFYLRGIEIDRQNASIRRGDRVDTDSYPRKQSTGVINGSIAPDLLDDGRIVEVKPSSRLTRGAELQLSYYLWYFANILDDEREGVLAFPTERRRETVLLTDDRSREVEEAIVGIHEIAETSSPPKLEEKPYCDSCAYRGLCWT